MSYILKTISTLALVRKLAYERLHHKRRIAIVYFDLDIGGIQQKIIDITKQFSREFGSTSPRVYLLLWWPPTKKTFHRYTPSNTSVYYGKPVGIRFRLYLLLCIVFLDPKSILTFQVTPSLTVLSLSRLLFWRHTPTVVSIDTMLSDSFRRKEFSKHDAAQLPMLFSDARKIIVPTLAVKSDLSKNFYAHEENIRVIPNWTKLLKPSSKHIDLLYAGRLAPEKRLYRLIDAVANLHHLHHSLSLYIVGDGPSKIFLQRKISRMGLQHRITFILTQQSITHYLRSSRIAIFCSGDRDAMPMFLLEAMGAALPVVCWNFKGANEFIIHNKTGYICRSSREFVTFIHRLLTQSQIRKRFGKEGQMLAYNKFSTENIVLYTHLLSQ